MLYENYLMIKKIVKIKKTIIAKKNKDGQQIENDTDKNDFSKKKPNAQTEEKKEL